MAGGQASYLQALESRGPVIEARSQQIDLEKEAFAARAELERHVGYRLPPAKPPTECAGPESSAAGDIGKE